DGESGWRQRGPLAWLRKLAGADAVSDRPAEEAHAEGSSAELHARPEPADGSGAAPPDRGGAGDHRRHADDDGWRGRAGDVAQPLPDGGAPGARGGDGVGDAEAGGPTGTLGAGAGAGGGERDAAATGAAA